MKSMNKLNAINKKDTRKYNGGGKVYFCPWGDYQNSNFWKTYGHAIRCGHKHGLFNIPINTIKAGLRLR